MEMLPGYIGTHSIHGTGMSTYIYLKTNQMQVNIPYMDGIGKFARRLLSKKDLHILLEVNIRKNNFLRNHDRTLAMGSLVSKVISSTSELLLGCVNEQPGWPMFLVNDQQRIATRLGLVCTTCFFDEMKSREPNVEMPRLWSVLGLGFLGSKTPLDCRYLEHFWLYCLMFSVVGFSNMFYVVWFPTCFLNLFSFFYPTSVRWSHWWILGKIILSFPVLMGLSTTMSCLTARIKHPRSL